MTPNVIYLTPKDCLLFVDPGGGINQIPGECTISGDVRLCFLSCEYCKTEMSCQFSYFSVLLVSG